MAKTIKKEDNEWRPTIAGSLSGFMPQYREKKDKEWHNVPLGLDHNGVPPPFLMGGVLETMGFYGHAQAQALAWWYCAFRESKESKGPHVKVRLKEYEIAFDLKAREKGAINLQSGR